MRHIFLALGLFCALSAMPVRADAPAATAKAFPFHDGDRVVFLGDSITEQQLYTNYIETYLLTRFPTWKLSFRNAGWGGDTSYLRQRGVAAPQALQRDVLDLHPTVVTIDFGMNDAGYGGFNQDLYDKHMAGETAIVHQLEAADVQPVLLSPSAVEKNEPGDDYLGYNQILEKFAAGDAALAAQSGAPFADQLHPFIDAINRLRTISPGLRLTPDVIHPQHGGQLMMADFILTGLNAPAYVSSATINAKRGTVSGTVGATVTHVVRANGGVSFSRLDRALVFPIDPTSRPVLQIVPVADDINKYIVQVTDLDPGSYTIAVNGVPITRCSATQLAGGVNLGYYDSPLSAAGMQILNHVNTKNSLYFMLWRGLQLHVVPVSDATLTTASVTQKIADEERQINALRHPATFEFKITRVIAPS